jgi:Heme/copper-type cytochrome/quinol oxidase, subunit 3
MSLRQAQGRTRDAGTPARPIVDVSALAPGAFGYRSVMWWGTMGLILIEGTAFALAIGAYFFLRTRNATWPPAGIAPPDLLWGTVNTLVLLLSGIPNQLARRAAEKIDLRGVQIWIVVALLFGVAFNAVRVLEFMHLNVWWAHDAYGSVVWLLLGLHTTHIVTDFLDTLVLAVLMFAGPIEEKRFVDVEENSAYWYFVVFAWLPIYGVIYWAPRVL